MLSQSDLLQLAKGEPVDHYLVIKKIELRNRRDSRQQYLSIELGDKTCSAVSNIWENYDGYLNFKCGDIVKVTGTLDDYQGIRQIRITSFRPVDFSDNVSPQYFMMKSKRDPEEMRKEFLSRMEEINDYKLKILMNQIFCGERFEKFLTAPAGKQWHHSYIHGLVEHTLEIMKLCDLMCDIHPEINRDLLICGAMMHDFGKIEELSYDSVFEYTDKGKLLGHIVISAMLINEEAKKIAGFSEELKDCLIHIVLSHQGKLEYASPVVPKTLEAITLYQADELSAKANAYKNAIATELKGDSKWTRFLSLVSTDLFNHGISAELEEEIKKTLFD
jgi:3'-5' exoribonuclease